jgi:hypothetical protein
MSLLSGQGYQRYACKSNCKINKCKCKASGILCNFKCHQSLPCLNKYKNKYYLLNRINNIY